MKIMGFRGIVTQAELVVVKLKKPKKESAPNIFCAGGCGVLPGNRYYAGIETSGGGIQVSGAYGHLFRTGKQSGGAIVNSRTLNDYMDRIVLLPQIDIAVAAGNEGTDGGIISVRRKPPPYSHSFELKVGENGKAVCNGDMVWTAGQAVH